MMTARCEAACVYVFQATGRFYGYDCPLLAVADITCGYESLLVCRGHLAEYAARDTTETVVLHLQ